MGGALCYRARRKQLVHLMLSPLPHRSTGLLAIAVGAALLGAGLGFYLWSRSRRRGAGGAAPPTASVELGARYKALDEQEGGDDVELTWKTDEQDWEDVPVTHRSAGRGASGSQQAGAAPAAPAAPGTGKRSAWNDDW